VNSDLAWRDATTLASQVVAPPGAVQDPFPGLDLGLFAEPAARAAEERTVETRTTGRVRLGAAVSLGTVREEAAAVRIPGIRDLIDPQIWSATATLPAAGREPRRLMLREVERYYTHRTVPENVGGMTRRRRVIEERLVYAVVFDL
jgi:hypothetical protein